MVAATGLGQPLSFIQGTVMAPTVEQLAMALPETRPNRKLAQTET